MMLPCVLNYTCPTFLSVPPDRILTITYNTITTVVFPGVHTSWEWQPHPCPRSIPSRQLHIRIGMLFRECRYNCLGYKLTCRLLQAQNNRNRPPCCSTSVLWAVPHCWHIRWNHTSLQSGADRCVDWPPHSLVNLRTHVSLPYRALHCSVIVCLEAISDCNNVKRSHISKHVTQFLRQISTNIILLFHVFQIQVPFHVVFL